MPVPRNIQKLYPGGSLRSVAWRSLRARILRRAGDRCEGTPQRPWCRVGQHQVHPETGSRVVLSVCHLDHDPTNNTDANLRAVCQLCHNSWDAPKRHLARWFSRRDLRARCDLFGLVRPRVWPVPACRRRPDQAAGARSSCSAVASSGESSAGSSASGTSLISRATASTSSAIPAASARTASTTGRSAVRVESK